MRFLFIVQGEGRGHLTQALSLAEIIREEGHELVKVLVGKSERREIPMFFSEQIRCSITVFDSPNFLPSNKDKQASISKSIIYNLSRVINFYDSILLLRNEINNNNIDIVINFYELLTGFTNILFSPKPKVISIAHQYLFLHPDYIFPNAGNIELFLLRLFTRCTALGSDKKFALSFKELPEDYSNNIIIIPPLLRNNIFALKPSKKNYILGYMVNNGYIDEVVTWHMNRKHKKVHIFWDSKQEEEIISPQNNLYFHRINDKNFLEYLCHASAYVSTAGFESICEAIYLGKKLLVIPSHIEQLCNANEIELYGFGKKAESFNLSALNYPICKNHNIRIFKNWVDRRKSIIMNQITAVYKDNQSFSGSMKYNYTHIKDFK